VTAALAELRIFGKKYSLPPRATVKWSAAAEVAWIESAGVIVTVTADGPQVVTADEHAALIESWALLP
jgi:hypothetical protein